MDIWAEARIEDACQALASEYESQAKEGDKANERAKKLEDDVTTSAKAVEDLRCKIQDLDEDLTKSREDFFAHIERL